MNEDARYARHVLDLAAHCDEDDIRELAADAQHMHMPPSAEVKSASWRCRHTARRKPAMALWRRVARAATAARLLISGFAFGSAPPSSPSAISWQDSGADWL